MLLVCCAEIEILGNEDIDIGSEGWLEQLFDKCNGTLETAVVVNHWRRTFFLISNLTTLVGEPRFMIVMVTPRHAIIYSERYAKQEASEDQST